MSIDAVVQGVTIGGSGTRLNLAARGKDGPGQQVLYVENPPERRADLASLIRCEIWGGSSYIMLGDKRLATRTSYLGIVLVDDWQSLVVDYRSEKLKCDKWRKIWAEVVKS